MVMSSLSACEKATPEKSCWDLGKNNELYWFQGWGENYVDINEQGNIIITPDRSGPAFDLHELVQSLVQRGIEPPILLRFDGFAGSALLSRQLSKNLSIKISIILSIPSRSISKSMSSM